MTYLEKLIELNQKTLKKFSALFAAKLLLEESETKNHQLPSFTDHINLLFLDYEAVRTESKKLISYIKLNRIKLTQVI